MALVGANASGTTIVLGIEGVVNHGGERGQGTDYEKRHLELHMCRPPPDSSETTLVQPKAWVPAEADITICRVCVKEPCWLPINSPRRSGLTDLMHEGRIAGHEP